MTRFPKSPFPFLKIEYGLIKVLLSEVGPTGIREIEFGIGQLIKQKIAYSVLPACPDHEFRVRKISG